MPRLARFLSAALLAAAALVPSSAPAGQATVVPDVCSPARKAWACYYNVVLEATFIRPGIPEQVIIRRSSGFYDVDQKALSKAYCHWRLVGTADNPQIVLPVGFGSR